ncbi:hypothetical protein ACV242_000045 [Peribacillus simplex]
MHFSNNTILTFKGLKLLILKTQNLMIDLRNELFFIL